MYTKVGGEKGVKRAKRYTCVHQEGKEGKFKGYLVLFGWESMEAHAKFRQSETFNEIVGPVRAIGKGIKVVSVNSSVECCSS